MAKLDERITNAILKLLKDSHPKWVTQEEIYIYLEDNLDFNEKQKQLHEQISGQIEENWQHDARNLIHSLKRKGEIICPHSEVYGLPYNNELEKYKISTTWGDFLSLAKQQSEKYSIINEKKIYIKKSNHNVTNTLFEERIKHFIYCRGIIEIGSFHNWIEIEMAFVDLTKELNRYEHDDGRLFIIHEKLLNDLDLKDILNDRLDKIIFAKERLRKIEKEKGKKKRRTESRGARIRFALDKRTRTRVYIGEANKAGSDVYICGNPKCGEPIFTGWRKDTGTRYFSHKELKPGMHNCKWRVGSKDDGSSKWTKSEKQRNREILDIKLEKQIMIGYQVLTIGDGLHGFPIDMQHWSRKKDFKIIKHSNLFNSDGKPGSISKLEEWSKKNIGSSPSVKIIDASCDSNIKFEQNGIEYYLSAKPLAENNLFLLDTPEDSVFTRVRPSSDVPENEWFNNYAPGQYIGVLQEKEFSHRNPDIRNELLQGLDMYLTIFDTNILEHLDILEEKFKVSKKYSKDLDFDVLVAEPIEAHPKTPEMIRVRNREEVCITAKFLSNVNDKIISPEIFLETYVDGSTKITSESLEDYYEDGWTRKRIPARIDDKLKEIKVRTGDDYGRIQKPASGLRIRTFKDQRKPILGNGDYFNPSYKYDNAKGLEMNIIYKEKNIENDSYDLFDSQKKNFFVKNWNFFIDIPLINGLKITKSICTMKVDVTSRKTGNRRIVFLDINNNVGITKLQEAIDYVNTYDSKNEYVIEEVYVEWDDDRLQAIPEFVLRIPSKIERERLEREEKERLEREEKERLEREEKERLEREEKERLEREERERLLREERERLLREERERLEREEEEIELLRQEEENDAKEWALERKYRHENIIEEIKEKRALIHNVKLQEKSSKSELENSRNMLIPKWSLELNLKKINGRLEKERSNLQILIKKERQLKEFAEKSTNLILDRIIPVENLYMTLSEIKKMILAEEKEEIESKQKAEIESKMEAKAKREAEIESKMEAKAKREEEARKKAKASRKEEAIRQANISKKNRERVRKPKDIFQTKGKKDADEIFDKIAKAKNEQRKNDEENREMAIATKKIQQNVIDKEKESKIKRDKKKNEQRKRKSERERIKKLKELKLKKTTFDELRTIIRNNNDNHTTFLYDAMCSKSLKHFYELFRYDMNLNSSSYNSKEFFSYEMNTERLGINPVVEFEAVLKVSKIKGSCPRCNALSFDYFVTDILGSFLSDKNSNKKKIKKNILKCKSCNFDISNKKIMHELMKKEQKKRA